MEKIFTKNRILLFLLFVYTFILMYFSHADNDYIWNYGFCYNFAKGMTMYKDYNMIITPLYPTIFGILLKIFGTNIITFTFFNALMIMLFYLLIYKNYKKAFLPIIIFCSFSIRASYNFLCVLLLFILMYLEDKKNNDYLIGVFLGLIFLTKSSFILLTLVCLFYIKDIKKILKRFIGFLIPNIIFIIYFGFNNSLINYLNYSFGGLFDFAGRSSTNLIGLCIILIVLIYLIYLYIKKKDIKILYTILFQIMSYPLFNTAHILYSLMPVIFCIFYFNNINIKNKELKHYIKIPVFVLFLCPLMALIIFYNINNCEFGTNSLNYKLIESKYITDMNTIKDNVEDLDNVYFIMYEAYYNKLLLNLNINEYDLLLKGNIGYDGENRVINYFDSLDNGTLFLTYSSFEGGDASKEIYDHVTNNYQLIKTFDKYSLYKK